MAKSESKTYAICLYFSSISVNAPSVISTIYRFMLKFLSKFIKSF